MKPAVTLFVIVAIIALMWSAAAVKVTGPDMKPSSATPYTPAMCDSVSNGMTFDEVKGILGKPSEVIEGTSPVTGDSQITAVWSDSRGAAIRCKFVNGSMASKVVDPIVYNGAKEPSS